MILWICLQQYTAQHQLLQVHQGVHTTLFCSVLFYCLLLTINQSSAHPRNRLLLYLCSTKFSNKDALDWNDRWIVDCCSLDKDNVCLLVDWWLDLIIELELDRTGELVSTEVHSLHWLVKQLGWPSRVLGKSLKWTCVCVIILCEQGKNDLFGSRWVRMSARWGIPWSLVELGSTSSSSFVELTN